MNKVEKALVVTGLESAVADATGMTFVDDEDSDMLEGIIEKEFGGLKKTEDGVRFIETIQTLAERLISEIKEADE